MELKKLFIGMCVMSVASVSFALNPKIDRYVLTQLKNRQWQQVMVIMKDQADLSGADALLTREEKGRFVYDTLRKKALETQGSLVEFLRSKKADFRQFYIENMVTVDNPSAEMVQALAARPDVAKIKGNPSFSLELPNYLTPLEPIHVAGPEKNIMRIGSDKVWKQFNAHGEGIVIAGQDTGVQWNHPALVKQYRGFTGKTGTANHNYNWHDAMHKPLASMTSTCGHELSVPCDDVGHGTHTIGTVVGDDGKGNQIGVAPKAKWIACRNMYNGVGTPASYIECFEFFLAPYPLNGNSMKDGDPSRAPHVMNNSWGCTAEEGCTGDEIKPSLEAMKKAGIFVVASAGNDGPRCSTIDSPPAWHSGLTLSVGAYNHRDDTIAYFSSRGPSSINGGIGPNITAPGVAIRSSVPNDRYESMMWSGTSMAGPHAVGAIALLWSYDNHLIGKIEDTIGIIEKSAEPKTTNENCGGVPGSHIPNNTYGSGLLNVWKAICSQSGHC